MSRGSNLPWDGFWKGLSGVLCTLAAVTLFTLATALLGIPLSRMVTSAIVLGSVLAAWGITRAVGAAEERRSGCGSHPALPPERGDSPRGFQAVQALAGGLYLLLWIAAILTPERSWDGNAYHLPTIHEWLRAGQVHWVDPRLPQSPRMNSFPKGAELEGMIAVRLLGDSRFSNCQNLLFLPLGFLGTACLARLAGVGPSLSTLCGSLFLLVPLNIQQSVTTYVDSAYACTVATFLAALGWTLHRLCNDDKVPWQCLPILGSAAGLALGVRPTAALPLLGGGLILGVVLAHGARRSLPASRRLRAGASFLALTAVWSLAIGGYWYARNLRHEGNPVYPVGISLFGRTLFEGESLEALGVKGQAPRFMRGWSHPTRVLYTWAQGGTAWPGSIRGEDNRSGGLGFLWLLGCLPATVLVVTRVARQEAQRARLLPFLACGGVVLASFLLTPENWWPRFTLWIYALGLPCFVMVAEEAFQGATKWSARKLWITLCIAGAAGEALVASAQLLSRSYPGPRPVRLAQLFEAKHWVWPDNFVFPATRGSLLDRVLASRETVAFGPALPDSSCRVRNGMMGQLAHPVGERLVVPIPLSPGRGDLLEMAARGVRYIIWDEGENSRGCLLPESLRESGEGWEQRNGFWMARMKPRGEHP